MMIRMMMMMMIMADMGDYEMFFHIVSAGFSPAFRMVTAAHLFQLTRVFAVGERVQS